MEPILKRSEGMADTTEELITLSTFTSQDSGNLNLNYSELDRCIKSINESFEQSFDLLDSHIEYYNTSS
jgi:hypothetical protein